MPKLLILDAAVDALAVHRITRFVVEDTIVARQRDLFLGWCDEHAPKVSEGLSCWWCTSIWVSAGVVAARRKFPTAWPVVAEWLALSSAAGILSGNAA